VNVGRSRFNPSALVRYFRSWRISKIDPHRLVVFLGECNAFEYECSGCSNWNPFEKTEKRKNAANLNVFGCSAKLPKLRLFARNGSGLVFRLFQLAFCVCCNAAETQDLWDCFRVRLPHKQDNAEQSEL